MKKIITQIIQNKCINGTRHFILRYLTGMIPISIIIEYPRSGGSWLGQLISSYLEIPFPRNKMPKFYQSMYHGHYLPSTGLKKCENVFLIIRDGRDVMVSKYFHSLIWNERNILDQKMVLYNRKKLGLIDLNNVKENLPKFIEYQFTHIPSRFIRFQQYGNWREFYKIWMNEYKKNEFNNNIIITFYEKLLENTKDELIEILSKIIDEDINVNRVEKVVECFSFKKQSNRNSGDENAKSFLRKGISGDWINYFNKEASEIFNFYAGDMLIELGYEKDENWIKK